MKEFIKLIACIMLFLLMAGASVALWVLFIKWAVVF